MFSKIARGYIGFKIEHYCKRTAFMCFKRKKKSSNKVLRISTEFLLSPGSPQWRFRIRKVTLLLNLLCTWLMEKKKKKKVTLLTLIRWGPFTAECDIMRMIFTELSSVLHGNNNLTFSCFYPSAAFEDLPFINSYSALLFSQTPD